MESHIITNEQAKVLLKLVDDLIMEVHSRSLIRGSKVSRDLGMSWEKTPRLESFEQARIMLEGVISTRAEQPSAAVVKRSKAESSE